MLINDNSHQCVLEFDQNGEEEKALACNFLNCDKSIVCFRLQGVVLDDAEQVEKRKTGIGGLVIRSLLGLVASLY